MANLPKKEALEMWESLDENQDPYPHMTPLPYKSKGSTYGACGVRIDGNRDFVESVMSCLKTLIQGENNETRLQLTFSEVKSTEIKGERKNFNNAENDAVCCYIRLHERGNQARAMNVTFDVHGEKTRR